MVEVWKKQAETAAKVTAAIAAPKGDPEKGMKEDLREGPGIGHIAVR